MPPARFFGLIAAVLALAALTVGLVMMLTDAGYPAGFALVPLAGAAATALWRRLW